ncbi:MAG: polysaccharide biosynthesis protein, partial [Succinivibrio sp.]
ETFIPKIPSIRITDLARIIAPGIPIREIGIRPGEKIHEVMCPRDDSEHIIEFDKFFIIKPSLTFFPVPDSSYLKTRLGEEGRPVSEGFEYNSKDNPVFMTDEQLREVCELS